MNKRNNPESLVDTALARACQMVRRAGVNWTRRLRSAAVTGRSSWLQEIESVEEECVLVRAHLASLTVSLVSEVIIVYALREFTKIIASYNDHISGALRVRFLAREINEDVCSNMLKSVLLPCVSKCSISNMQSNFIQTLVIKLLYVIPNIKALILPSAHPSYLQLLVERIQILTHLQEFRFHIGCTTEILIELSRFCRHMKHLSVQESRLVDDYCVEHLLKLTQLCGLNVAATSISNIGYRKLLLCLPEIENITWFSPIDTVLGNLRVYFPSVMKFVGTVSHASIIFWKCPNIKELELLSPAQAISDLAGLRNVSSFSLFRCSYTGIALGVVIRCLGQNLTNLKMNEILDININDLINYCTVLKELSILYSHMIIRRTFELISPHFRNLKVIRLRYDWGPFDFSSILHLYINLNVLHLVGMVEITDTFMKQTVTAGGFRNLTECFIEFCGDMSMDTAWLLLQNCPNLTTIGNIDSWSRVDEREVAALLTFLRNNNLSLEVCR
ncbi:hypothetical protein B7P43_G03364 [Cryptotermes secundus]|uniref:F-box domain-containing protein n=1 Tax=Cryptotermes secundus TaxID=105785 RepID=A0A2J7QXV6_9NEOP|nr:uncharacterized protein LOC111864626 [Cryptotermes secundus]XP_023707768.1 uncharacterized protein LOC111864626 [Cryptotermes secundus]PNF33416.1 hypothetical protein B7P43_G03364 [Cryptotermes secundus]